MAQVYELFLKSFGVAYLKKKIHHRRLQIPPPWVGRPQPTKYIYFFSLITTEATTTPESERNPAEGGCFTSLVKHNSSLA